MRSQKTVTALIAIAAVAAIALGRLAWRRPADRDFARKIAEARADGASHGVAPAPGLPFFLAHSLTPTWNAAAPLVSLPSLQLVDHEGRPRSRSDFEGKTTFLAFFFTSCTGFCPAFVRNLRGVARALEAVPGVQYVAVSVDPETDTPPRLREYARALGLANKPEWRFLTGSRDTIYGLARDTFASEAFRRAAPGTIVHSEHFYLLDPEGRLRAVLNGTRLDVAGEATGLVAGLTPPRG